MSTHAAAVAPGESRGVLPPDSPVRVAVNDAAVRVIHSMSITELAKRTGIAARRWYRWGTGITNVAPDDYRDIPAWVVPLATIATGRDDLLTAQADAAARVVVPRLAVALESRSLPLLSRVAQLTEEAADVLHLAGEVMADGALTPPERRAFRLALDDLVRAAERLRLSVEEPRKPLAKAGAR